MNKKRLTIIMLICVAIIVAVSVISIILIKTHPISTSTTEETPTYQDDEIVDFDWGAWETQVKELRGES